MNIKILKDKQCLQIKWQLTNLEIPLADITEVLNDDTYGGEEKAAIRIGYPYGNTERVVILTKNETYIIFTNTVNLRERILSSITS